MLFHSFGATAVGRGWRLATAAKREAAVVFVERSMVGVVGRVMMIVKSSGSIERSSLSLLFPELSKVWEEEEVVRSFDGRSSAGKCGGFPFPKSISCGVTR